jgi:hypothetical protein
MLDYNTLFKYPSTPHLPQSRSKTNDDHVLTHTDHLHGKNVIITMKMDGESASLYSHHFHARSLDSQHHVSRDWIKAFWNERRHDIPTDWRICGENLYAQHSIRYEDLPSYFMGFSIWDDQNTNLTWDETVEWFNLLDIVPVPVLYRGEYSDKVVDDLISSLDTSKDEGFVVRVDHRFPYGDFGKNMAKWVRPRHVQTSEFWRHQAIIPNGLRSNISSGKW